VWRWHQLPRKGGSVYDLRDESQAGLRQTEVPHLAVVSAAIEQALFACERDGLIGRWHLAVEGLFVHPLLSKQTAIELGRTVGWLTSALVAQALTYHDSAMAREWRPAVLGVDSYCKKERADALSVQRLGSRWRGELAADGHVADADCIAWHRRTQLRLEEAQPALVEPSRKRRAR
jgi:hypothetical protein